MKRSLICIALIGSIGLSGCATFEKMTPQEQLNLGRLSFNSAIATYNAICAQSQHPASCDDPRAVAYKDAVIRVADAGFAAAQASIDAGKPDTEAVIKAAMDSLSALLKLVNELRPLPSG